MIDHPLSDSKWFKRALAEIAEKMGLRGIDRFGPGRAILRNEKGWRDGEARIVHTWYAAICPAFEDPALIAVCRTAENEFRGQVTPAFHKAGMALIDPEHQAVIDLEHDPVREAAVNLDLLARSGTVSLDGISYCIEFNGSCRAWLRFSNPTVDCLVKLEKALLQLTRQIAMHSRVRALHEFTEKLGKQK